MRFVLKSLGVLALLYGVGIFTGFVDFSPGGETVLLRTFDDRGIGADTTIWIVEVGAHPYVRSDRPESDWLLRLRVNPAVQVIRGGQETSYNAVVVPKMQQNVNRAMAEKYGLAARLLGMVLDPANSTPIRLERRRE